MLRAFGPAIHVDIFAAGSLNRPAEAKAVCTASPTHASGEMHCPGCVIKPTLSGKRSRGMEETTTPCFGFGWEV
eukprot:7299779-Pyramimonas_sp.AAC.1